MANGGVGDTKKNPDSLTRMKYLHQVSLTLYFDKNFGERMDHLLWSMDWSLDFGSTVSVPKVPGYSYGTGILLLLLFCWNIQGGSDKSGTISMLHRRVK